MPLKCSRFLARTLNSASSSSIIFKNIQWLCCIILKSYIFIEKNTAFTLASLIPANAPREPGRRQFHARVQVSQTHTCNMTMRVPNRRQRGKPTVRVRITATQYCGRQSPSVTWSHAPDTRPFQSSPSGVLRAGPSRPATRETCSGCGSSQETAFRGACYVTCLRLPTP